MMCSNRSSNRNSNRGFTLLEVMLGLAITAAVMVILLSALRMGHRSQEKGLARSDLAQRMRIVSDRLAWMLGGAYPYRFQDPDDEKESYILFRGSGDSLEFVTTSVDVYSETLADLAGLKFVRLYLDDDGFKAAERIFFMGVDEDDDEGEEEFVFAPHVESVSFEYMDVDEDTGTAEWVSEWDTEENDYLPAVVRVSVTIIHAGDIVEVPPVMAAIRIGGSRGLLVPGELGTGAVAR
ncbi:MAG: prepilin-type N-terminal cleavage/methylation domain-containing protein [Thermodesulfovibrionales bacterium]|nr:prepilin-type N-terminal cleavage/methylation domain-containing protein [Thermodesulfovibrionales bacterium]